MAGDLISNLQCPIPKSDYEHILLAHGGGGKLTQQLIEKMIYSRLGNEILEKRHDGAFIPHIPGELAMTTDSFVVDPIFFPGGDIGDLAINGTVALSANKDAAASTCSGLRLSSSAVV